MWSLILTFVACLGVESHTSPKHLLKMQTSFRRISSPKHFWSAPSWRDRISGPASCLRGPGPSSPLASTAAPLDSRSSTASTWPLNAARWSGVLPQALPPGKPSAAVASGVVRRGRLRGNDENCGQLCSTRSTDCFGLNIFKTVQSKIYSQTKWTSFNTSFL